MLPRSRRSNTYTILTGDFPPPERGLGLRDCRIVQGPTWGYPTEGAYYRDASSSDSLIAVKIPLFAFHAEDDPVYRKQTFFHLPFPDVRTDSSQRSSSSAGIQPNTFCSTLPDFPRGTSELV